MVAASSAPTQPTERAGRPGQAGGVGCLQSAAGEATIIRCNGTRRRIPRRMPNAPPGRPHRSSHTPRPLDRRVTDLRSGRTSRLRPGGAAPHLERGTLDYGRCRGPQLAGGRNPLLVSLDSVWEAFVHQHDVYLRHRGGGDSIRLTTDGEEFWSYGLSYPRPNDVRKKTPRRPDIRWSPDSRRLAVYRLDQRNVELMY